MKKLLLGALIVMTVLVMSVGTVFAQEEEPTTISGTVQSVEVDYTTTEPTVLVTLVTDQGEQTVRISLDTAISLVLVELVDDDGDPLTPDVYKEKEITDLPVDPIDINSGDVIADEGEEEAQHPVATALDTFFSDLFGFEVGYDTIMALHEDGVELEDGTTTGGFGFGVIAQALWMTKHLEGDAGTFEDILQAKADGNYDDLLNGLTDENGNPIEASNWGQFKKAVMNLNDDEDKKNAKGNLGSVMSNKNETDSEGQIGAENSPQIKDDDNQNGNGNSDNDHPTGKKDKPKGNKGRGHNK